jgi:hypothetical protein
LIKQLVERNATPPALAALAALAALFSPHSTLGGDVDRLVARPCTTHRGQWGRERCRRRRGWLAAGTTIVVTVTVTVTVTGIDTSVDAGIDTGVDIAATVAAVAAMLLIVIVVRAAVRRTLERSFKAPLLLLLLLLFLIVIQDGGEGHAGGRGQLSIHGVGQSQRLLH